MQLPWHGRGLCLSAGSRLTHARIKKRGTVVAHCMAKIKVPSGGSKAVKAPFIKKKRVRLKNAFQPSNKKRRLIAKAKTCKIIARKRLSCFRKTTQSFREAFGASDDEVSA